MTSIPATPAAAPAATTPAFVEPPADTNPDGSTPIPTTVAPAEPTEEMTPEEAAAEIERLRADNDKWTKLARKHERENKTLKAGTTPPATPAVPPAGTPPASTGPSESDLKALRFEVALDKGLPKAMAVRLQGSTLEEIEADADELLKLPGFAPAPTPPRFGGSADGGAGGSAPPKAPTFGDQVRAAVGIKLQ